MVGYPSRAIRFRALHFRAVLSRAIHTRTILSRAAQFCAIRVSAAFPQAKHRGCHFHFCRAIYRSVQRMRLVGVCSFRQLMYKHLSATTAAMTSDLNQRIIDTLASRSQNVIDEAVRKRRKRLRASMRIEAKGHHCEHLLN